MQLDSDSIRRVLLVDDVKALDDVRLQLERRKVRVELTDPVQVAARALSFEPHLIVTLRTLRTLHGRDVVGRLAAFAQTSALPVAFAEPETTELELLRAVWAGAVDVIESALAQDAVDHVMRLLEEPSLASAPQGENTGAVHARRLLDIYRRRKHSGVLRLNPGTPFEGMAVFELGALISAEYGPLKGVAALEEMLWFEEGVWRFDSDATPTTRPTPPVFRPPPEPHSLQPRLLFVDDDEDFRNYFSAKLSDAGFEVRTANHGLAALSAAADQLPELVLSDIDMPALDGWGLLRQFRADHRTRDVPVVFLSGRDDLRESLRAARAGAYDYLSKTTDLDFTLRRVAGMGQPFTAGFQALQARQALTLDTQAAGLQWFLRRAAELKVTGTFEAHDAWGVYVLRIRDGEPVDALSTTSQKTAREIGAVAALLVARNAQALFSPGPVKGPRHLQMGMDALLEKVCETLNRLEWQVINRRLHTAHDFVVDPELYALFLKLCPEREVQVARAVCEQHVAPAQLMEKLSLPAAVVEGGLKEMLRRRVIRFPEGSS